MNHADKLKACSAAAKAAGLTFKVDSKLDTRGRKTYKFCKRFSFATVARNKTLDEAYNFISLVRPI